MEKKFRKFTKEPHFIDAEKKALAETEDQPIVRIPPVARIHPISIQPEPILIVFQFEHVRIAVAVSFVYCAIHFTACAIYHHIRYKQSLKFSLHLNFKRRQAVYYL